MIFQYFILREQSHWT